MLAKEDPRQTQRAKYDLAQVKGQFKFKHWHFNTKWSDTISNPDIRVY